MGFFDFFRRRQREPEPTPVPISPTEPKEGDQILAGDAGTYTVHGVETCESGSDEWVLVFITPDDGTELPPYLDMIEKEIGAFAVDRTDTAREFCAAYHRD